MASLDLSDDEPLVPPALKRLNVDPTKYVDWRLHGQSDTTASQFPESVPRPARSTLGEVVSQFNQHRFKSSTYLDRLSTAFTGLVRRVRGNAGETRLPLLHERNKYHTLRGNQRPQQSTQAAVLKEVFTDFNYADVTDGFTSISLDSSPEIDTVVQMQVANNNNVTGNRVLSECEYVVCESSNPRNSPNLSKEQCRTEDNIEMKEISYVARNTENYSEKRFQTTCFASNVLQGNIKRVEGENCRRNNVRVPRNRNKRQQLHRYARWSHIAAAASYIDHDFSDYSSVDLQTCPTASSPPSHQSQSEAVLTIDEPATCLTWEEYLSLGQCQGRRGRSLSCHDLCGAGWWYRAAPTGGRHSLVDLTHLGAQTEQAFPPLFRSRMCFSAMAALCSEDASDVAYSKTLRCEHDEDDFLHGGEGRGQTGSRMVQGHGGYMGCKHCCQLSALGVSYQGGNTVCPARCHQCRRSLSQISNTQKISPPFWESQTWETRHKFDVPLLT